MTYSKLSYFSLFILLLFSGCTHDKLYLSDAISFKVDLGEDISEAASPSELLLHEYLGDEYVGSDLVNINVPLHNGLKDGWRLLLIHSPNIGNLTLNDRSNPYACYFESSKQPDINPPTNRGVDYTDVKSMDAAIFVGSHVYYGSLEGSNITIDIVPCFLNVKFNIAFDANSFDHVKSCSAALAGMATRFNLYQKAVIVGYPGVISMQFDEVLDQSLDYNYTTSIMSLGVDIALSGSANIIDIDIELIDGTITKHSADLTSLLLGASASGRHNLEMKLSLSVSGDTGGSIGVDPSWDDTNIIPI